MANNSTNATIAGGNLYKETGLMLINYGTCIHPVNNLHSNQLINFPVAEKPYDGNAKKALSVTEVKSETNALYHQAVQELVEKGILIQSIICDGKAGLLKSFGDLPVQLCQFHQLKTVNRYLTNRPKTAAGRALKEVALLLKDSSEQRFKQLLENWLKEHENFLNEKTVNPETGHSFYTHKRLRSAFLSLKRNLDWLFTFERHSELSIPKTTNLLEGCFGDVKRLLSCHSGMKKENKIRFIKDYFSEK